MMLRRIFWAACSLSLASCAQIKRPDADICVLNAPGAKLTCYNLKDDYDDDGNIKPGAKPHFLPAPTLESINKSIVMSPAHFSLLKAYVKKLREEYENGCKPPRGK
jgi:hypothetical protein